MTLGIHELVGANAEHPSAVGLMAPRLPKDLPQAHDGCGCDCHRMPGVKHCVPCCGPGRRPLGVLIERRNVFAWTRHDVSYPPYVSLNRDGTGFELTVRSGAESGSMCASVHLDHDAVLALSRAIERGLT